MTHIIAKLRIRGNGDKYKKVLSLDNEEVYTLPADIASAIEYDPKYLLDENEWFFISNFSAQNYLFDIINKSSNFNSAEYRLLEKNMFSLIDFICVYQKGILYFQNIPKTRLVLQKGFFYIGDKFHYEDNFVGLYINKYPDALYNSQNDTLYFRKLSAISSIFKGIDQLYREATDEETKMFLNKEFITLINNFSVESVGKRNRHKIAMAIDTLNSFEIDEQKKLFKYIHRYRSDIKMVNGTFLIGSETELQGLLCGIEEQYYTTVIREEKRVANSVRPLKTNTGAIP